MRAFVVPLLCALAGPAVAFADGASDLARALVEERDGDPTAALATLERIVREAPNGALADDALFHQGRLLEERLGRPAEALARYRELLARFPHSRLARRAQGRAGMLTAELPAGEATLVELEAILRTPNAELPAGVRRMEILLRGAPALAPASRERAQLWLAGAYARLGQPGRALAVWEKVVAEGRDRPAAAEALQAIGEQYRSLGRTREAERTFRRLATLPGSRARAARGLAEVRRARTRRTLAEAGAGALVAAALGLAAFVVRRRGWTALAPSVEVAFLAPIGALLVGLAAAAVLRGDPRAPGGWQLGAGLRAVALLCGGGLVLAHLGGAVARSLERPVGRWLRVALPAGLAVAGILVVALTLEATGLGPFVLETLRAGAER